MNTKFKKSICKKVIYNIFIPHISVNSMIFKKNFSRMIKFSKFSLDGSSSIKIRNIIASQPFD